MQNYQIIQNQQVIVQEIKGSGRLILGNMLRDEALREVRPRFRCPETGNIYEGEWIQDQKDGHGKQIWANGTVYEGQWQDNLPHGIGKYTKPNGDTIEGSWREGKAHGNATYC